MFDQELVCAVAINKILPFEPAVSSALYSYCGSYSRLFSLSPGELSELLGKRRKIAEEISGHKRLKEAELEISKLVSAGYRVLHRKCAEYPQPLAECEDAPAVIFVKGEASLNSKNTISVVGTRRSTPYGESSCKRIIGELARSGNNPVIVSGLAYGIDITAHRAALDNGLRSIAVLPCGPDRIYPALHSAAAEKIALFGALVTEFPPGIPSFKMNFIQRNRIIAGLSRATLVIESDIKGGALTTAELAQSYSRDVFALPGRFGERSSSGCNMLIYRNIAGMFFSTAEFIKQMGWSGTLSSETLHPALFDSYSSEKEKIFVALKKNSELDRDGLLKITGLNIKILSSVLLEMEIDGVITPLAGNRFTVQRESL